MLIYIQAAHANMENLILNMNMNVKSVFVCFVDELGYVQHIIRTMYNSIWCL